MQTEMYTENNLQLKDLNNNIVISMSIFNVLNIIKFSLLTIPLKNTIFWAPPERILGAWYLLPYIN